MHICCSNCCIYPLQHYLAKEVEIKGLWFNPNIHPYMEYANRLASLQKLQKIWGLEVEYLDDYPLDDFLASVVGRGGGRCEVCYAVRLEKTAQTAVKMHLDGFTTSLLASPYQKFDVIINIGEGIGRRYGLPFHAEDLRVGWRLAKGLSTEFGLYRQKYCGCIYSEMDRYAKKHTKSLKPGPAGKQGERTVKE
jgi:predicted adenine nucleotide alpha hydrolase (AANH) superfamily ATPase